MDFIKDEFLGFLSNAKVWISYVVIGLIAKYSHDLVTGKKMTLVYACGSAGLALFIGYISYELCRINDMTVEASWIVPCATLLSDKIVMALFTLDLKAHLNKFITDRLTSMIRKFENDKKDE